MSVKIVYFSRTGNLKKFTDKLKDKGFNDIITIEPNLIVKDPYVLIVSTINFGEVPKEYKDFLKDNFKYMIGVSGSGNRNWGKNFAVAADKVSKKFKVPLISKFELSGNIHDVENFIKGVEKIYDGN